MYEKVASAGLQYFEWLEKRFASFELAGSTETDRLNGVCGSNRFPTTFRRLLRCKN